MVLHGREACPAVPLLEVQGLGELPGVHRGRAEIAGLPGLHHVVQRLQGLLQRRPVVVPVDHVDVDVVGAQPPQAGVDLGHDRLAGQAAAVGAAGAHGVADLGGDDDVVAVRVVLQGAAEDLLAGAVGVHVRGVEEVDARFEGVLDQGPAGFLVEGPDGVAAVGVAVGHGADGHGRDVEAGAAEFEVTHGGSPTMRNDTIGEFSG